MSEEAPVRHASFDDVPALVDVLVNAFDRDPFYNWLVLADAARPARCRLIFDVLLRRMSDGLTHTYTTAQREGCAIWKGPSHHELSLLEQLRLIPAFAKVMGARRIPRGLMQLGEMEAMHRRVAPEPHYYLFVLGVDPKQQRRGIGARLLAPMLERCDAERRLAYLETARADNVPFYERAGFVVQEVFQPKGMPKFWMMTRQPRPR